MSYRDTHIHFRTSKSFWNCMNVDWNHQPQTKLSIWKERKSNMIYLFVIFAKHRYKLFPKIRLINIYKTGSMIIYYMYKYYYHHIQVEFIWIAIEFPVMDFETGKLRVGQFQWMRRRRRWQKITMNAWGAVFLRIKRNEIHNFHFIMEDSSSYYLQRKVYYKFWLIILKSFKQIVFCI